jgi:type I restriction enzyme M protein
MNPTALPPDAPTPDGIHAAAWSAGERFRGLADPGLCQDLLLTMFFLKQVSDAWQDRRDSYQRQYGGHPALVEELLGSERFVLPAGAGFQALHARRHEPGNGGRIDQALQALEEANLARLRDVFQGLSFNSSQLGNEAQKNERLRRLLEDFARPALDLRDSRVASPDAIGDAYERLVRSFASAGGRKAGEFYTPPEVASLLARLVDPQPGDEIGDPACGSGSLLARCGRRVRERTGTRRYALFGQEADGRTWALARMNLFLHGDDNHRIEWGDSLRHPRLLDGAGGLKRFDVVVANPPFGLEAWGHEMAGADPFGRFRRGVPPRTKGDYAFLLHMVETLKPGTGRMAVVVPHGVLFRGAAEGRIRQALVEENLLDVVIGLPEKLFHGTAVPAVVLVLRRHKADDRVLFIDASRDCEAGRNQNLLREPDLQRILDTVAARRPVPRYAHLATPAEMAANGFNLNLPRYVAPFEPEPQVDLAAVRREREQLKAQLARLEAQIDGHLKELGHG